MTTTPLIEVGGTRMMAGYKVGRRTFYWNSRVPWEEGKSSLAAMEA
jgi:hypothetical protein